MLRAHLSFAVAAVLALSLSACGLQMPSDPHGTLDRARHGVMRVGVTENAPWVQLSGSSAPAGTEPELLAGFAESIDSEIEWTVASESILFDSLEKGELDVVAGGFLEDTLWAEKGAVTLPYAETTTEEGPEKHVMIVRMGENALLVALERFLLKEKTP